MTKKILLLCWILVLLFSFDNFGQLFNIGKVSFAAEESDSKQRIYPANYKITPVGPAKSQTVTIPVTGVAKPTPKVIWTQRDDGSWEATRNEGGDKYTALGVNTEGEAYKNNEESRPVMTEVKDKITANDYPPDKMVDTWGKVYNQKYITDLGFENVAFVGASSYEKVGDPEYQKGDIFAIIRTRTGWKVQPNYHKPYTDENQVPAKYRLEYYTPLKIDYTGNVTEQKEIQVTDDAELQVGDTTQLAAEVRTREYNMENFDDNWVNVTNRENTEWKSDDTSIATVSATGLVTAVGEGTAKVSAFWKSGEDENGKSVWYLTDSVEIAVGVDQQDPPEEPTGMCSIPQPGEQIIGKYMDPLATAVIKADSRGSEQFDVAKGIPTSESLYGNVLARTYLSKHTFTEYSGVCTYKVVVKRTYNLKWENNAGRTKRATETKNYSYEVKRPYSYWKIDNLEVYKIDQATLMNYAFAGEKIEISPNNYVTPSFAAKTTGQYYAPATPGVINGGSKSLTGNKSRPSIPNESSSFKSKAESAVDDVEVENDYLKFNGDVLMDNTRTAVHGPTPKPIPEPQMIGQNILYSPNNVIPNTKENRSNATSKGSIDYILMPGNIKGGANASYDIYGINTVTIHTPVVNYSEFPDENRPFDQRMEPDRSKVVFILDRPFTLNFDESGQHRDIKGYGNRDYKKYTLLKRVKFPFPVYSEKSDTYYPENKWIAVPVGQKSMVFKMPTWVDEGSYHIVTESWAINSQGKNNCQVNYNGDLQNYCATRGFDVDVVGKLFGFRIWDIGDLRFQDVFRASTNSKTPTGKSYYSGGRDENGNKTNMFGQNTWLLPIRPNSHPSQPATVPHNGYSFLFDLKTMGNMFDVGEGIRINPTFTYVSKKGGKQVPVDLYYDSTGQSNKFIKVGSSNDVKTFVRKIKLSDPYRNIDTTQLKDAASYEYKSILSEDQRKATNFANFSKKFMSRDVSVAAGYAIEVLNYQTRTLIGTTKPPEGVDVTKAQRSVQQWYGEYNLPVAPYILPQGTNIQALANKYGGKLDGHESEFYKSGYIMVHFDIYTVKNNNQNEYVLGYEAPIANMWKIEGQVSSDQDYLGNKFTFNTGDIAMFESDFSTRNDFQNQGR